MSFDILGEGRIVELSGWLTQNYRSGLVRFRSGRIRAQDYLSVWIDHLTINAMGPNQSTHLLGYDRKEGVVHLNFPSIADISMAQSHLGELIRLYYQGMTTPLAYFPNTALACVEAGFNRGSWSESQEKSFKKMAEVFNDGYFNKGEGANTYINRIWPQWSDELASQVWELAALVIQAPRLAVQADDEK